DDRLALDPESKGFDGILLDLGVSSLQLDSPERGFSFQREGPLDMRMDAGHGDGAGDWLAHADAAGLERVLRDYGEERQARRMASAVLRARDLGELRNTLDLARVAERVLGRPRPGQIHPATRLFQALRLAVNGELEALEHALPRLRGMLAQGGRLAVISFHSLEDRLVKEDFRRESRDCICPPGLPECRCGHKATVRELSRKPMEAGEAETAANPRSRSAKLRVVEKL
ncbi:MAG TPA: 16S rRNA (cytosine(1402)-N(4))-methyltransferase RsmH, partial [bacterium]|nr:16S rRNA (cytosine(1402)-N(4))-methyltransferase RsmH [bacterium]